MKIADIRLRRYALKPVRPLVIKGHWLDERCGYILSLIDSDGRIGFGEISPLPFLHKETIDEVVLCQIRQSLVGMDVQDGTVPFAESVKKSINIDFPPSVLFGIETALFDLHLQRTGCPLLSAVEVPLCGLTSTASESFYADLQQMLEQGYSAVKIKVGTHSIAQEADRIQASREIVGDKMVLRLDANRAWNLSDATAFCERVGSKRIEYIEEPVRDVCDQKAFAHSSDISLALDETLLEHRVDSSFDFGHIGVFVIKPGLVGGLKDSADIIDVARRHHITPVLSSSFQSGLAVRALFLFAGAMGLSDIPVGLDTLKWFAEDCLARQIPIVNGAVSLQQLLGQRPCFKEAMLTDV